MDARRLTHHHLMEVPSPVCTTAVGNSHATIALLVLLLVLVTVIVELVKSRNNAKLGERKWPERTENLRPMWCRPRDYVYGHKSTALAVAGTDVLCDPTPHAPPRPHNHSLNHLRHLTRRDLRAASPPWVHCGVLKCGQWWRLGSATARVGTADSSDGKISMEQQQPLQQEQEE